MGGNAIAAQVLGAVPNATGDARDRLIVYLQSKAKTGVSAAQGAALKELSARLGYKVSNPPVDAQHMDWVCQQVGAVFGEAVQ